MKVLWITNILFPEASAKLTGNFELKNSGGWMLGAANALIENTDVVLAIATVSNLVSKLTTVEGQKIKYFIIPLGKGNLKYNKDYEPYWKKIKIIYCPDIIHIHGSEFSHGLAWVRANGSDRVVVSIQGMPTVYRDYCYSGLSNNQILNMTLFGLLPILGKTGEKRYSIQSKSEVELLKLIHHVIGRTCWDKIHVRAINSEAEYFFCNETLRSEFYSGKWEYNFCRKHTIFLSQVGKSIKGFHQIIKALPYVLKKFPDTKVIVAGNNIYKSVSLLSSFRNRYCLIVRKMIKHSGLEEVFEFVGPQDGNGMKKYMLSSNVFVLPSSIENSPNSLGEAQLLGLPCISSYVGGVADMIPNPNCGLLYRFDEYKMLAFEICRMFDKASTFDNSEMRYVARKRHDASANAKRTLDIYNNILLKNNH